MGDPFDQSEYAVRFEWGLQGIDRIGDELGAICIVDVLSFTTAVEAATCSGSCVYPYRWKDETATAFAASVGAVLAKGRSRGGVSLSPNSLQALPAGSRVVLPSPNGAACVVAAQATGACVLAGCLRNARSTGEALQSHLDEHKAVGVIAAGELWSDGGLRPSFEDLVGAGAILDALTTKNASPEAHAAIGAFRAVKADLDAQITACASGKELDAINFGNDVSYAASLDVSTHVPILNEDHFPAAQ